MQISTPVLEMAFLVCIVSLYPQILAFIYMNIPQKINSTYFLRKKD